MPQRIKGISWFLNQFVGRLPFIEKACLVQYVTAKPKMWEGGKEASCSVLIPCYNEEGNIEECIRRTPSMGSSTEILVINDGSKDRTLEIATRVSKELRNVRVIDQPKNGGKGKAVMEGMRSAKGDILIILTPT